MAKLQPQDLKRLRKLHYNIKKEDNDEIRKQLSCSEGIITVKLIPQI